MINDARRSGLVWIAAGAILAGLWIAWILFVGSRGWSIYGPGLGLPVVPLLVGLTQLATGRRFGDLARSWDSLAGWQRGVLGLAIVAVAGIIIVGGIAVALSVLLD